MSDQPPRRPQPPASLGFGAPGIAGSPNAGLPNAGQRANFMPPPQQRPLDGARQMRPPPVPPSTARAAPQQADTQPRVAPSRPAGSARPNSASANPGGRPQTGGPAPAAGGAAPPHEPHPHLPHVPDAETRSDWFDHLVNFSLVVIGAILMFTMASIPLGARQQAILAVLCAVVFLIANRFPQRGISVFLVVLSLGVSMRYIFWRVTDTLGFPSVVELLLGGLLVTAELYAIIVLVLGYFQTLTLLERRPVALPDDVEKWPTVDVFIPTYNEPMSVVRATVLGAMSIDWPPEKLRIHILDDGRRDEFRRFAAQCGVGYITRTNNKHAKAGNLNHALTVTNGELVAIFDCDHIPNRAFLQLTVGWMVAQPRIALVQTPHHFYSPDPFQRNLAAGTRVPAEGNLFYGLLQDGNDFWDATFFCGSCAVIRRAALAEIGGFAVETVTEDAHTMLKLHRRGWDSAYIKLPLAAGLATERLALHIGQRARWARGMLQIFRTDCPLFGPGLSLGQRFCYTQAMGHFFFAIPRVIFLIAPLGYLLLNENLIAASPLAIVAYALPHIFHSVATNSRLQKNWRHSFWSEIYETAMALFLVRVTVETMISPTAGKFNVTAKGGLLDNGFFDLRAVYPNLILTFFLIAGLVRGVLSLLLLHVDTLTFQALLLNSIWATFSLLTALAALAVGRERRQIRLRHRIRAELPVAIYLPDGRVVVGQTRDMSQGGCLIDAEMVPGLKQGISAQVEFMVGGDLLIVPVRLLRWENRSLQVIFQPTSIIDESVIVAAVFGRPDAWKDWANYPQDRPLTSLWHVLVSIKGLFRPRDPGQQPRPVAAPGSGAPPNGPQPPFDPADDLAADNQDELLARRRRDRRRAMPARAAAVLLALLAAAATPAQGQQTQGQPLTLSAPPRPGLPAGNGGEMVVRPVPGPTMPAAPGTGSGQYTPPPSAYNPPSYTPPPAYAPPVYQPPAYNPPGYVPPTAAAPTQPTYAQPTYGAGAPTYGAPTYGAAPQQAPAALPGGQFAGFQPARAGVPQTRHVVYTLHQLGASGPLTLRGTSTLQGVQFGIRADEVVTQAELTVSGAMSPALIPEFSNDTITLNEQYIGTIPVNHDQPRFDNLTFPVSPVFFQDNNRLNTSFTGRYTTECNDPLSGLLWSTISDTSTLSMTLERLPPQRDLARLPLPFFDSHEKLMLNLPMVLGSVPSTDAMEVAGTVASWFGLLADYRGATFPVTSEAPPDGNAVVVVIGSERGNNLALPVINGPMLAVVPNPNDPSSSFLVIAGRNGAEAKQAAAALTLGSRAMSGDSMTVPRIDIPARKPYDAPYWIASDRPVKLGELVDAGDLQGFGYVPGTIRVPFRTAPDLYTWRGRPFVANIRFRTPPGPIIDLAVSRLDVGINNLFLTSFPFALDSSTNLLSRLTDFWGQQRSYRVDVPVYNVFGQNDLQFFFDARPLHRGDCVAVPNDLHMVVSPDSTIDISRAYRFTELPNLAFFVNSGFPFTRMADLSETAVVLSAQPTASEISAYLNLMGRIGSLTGYPTLGVTVVRPDDVASVADKDLLVMATVGRLGAAAELLSKAPVRVQNNGLTVELTNGLDSVRRIFGDAGAVARDKAATELAAGVSDNAAYLVGGESPLHRKRSVVAILATAPGGLDAAVATLRDPDQAPAIQGDLAVLSGGRVTAYRVGQPYTVGHLAPWVWPSYLLRDQPGAILLMMIFAAIVVAVALFRTLHRRMSARSVHWKRS